VPGGTGKFNTFSNVTFWGAGTASQQGIYASLFGTLTKIADRNTPIPGGTGPYSRRQNDDRESHSSRSSAH
jgi:hypothetical protein